MDSGGALSAQERERDLRKAMFGKMVIIERMIRGLIRPFGLKVGRVSTGGFEARVGALVRDPAEPEQLVERLEDVLQHSGAFHSTLVST
jgi:hypothetical protein